MTAHTTSSRWHWRPALVLAAILAGLAFGFSLIAADTVEPEAPEHPASAGQAIAAAVLLARQGHYDKAASLLHWTRHRAELAAQADPPDPAFTLTAVQTMKLEIILDHLDIQKQKSRRAAYQRAQLKEQVAAKEVDSDDSGEVEPIRRLSLDDIEQADRIAVQLILKRHARLYDPDTGMIDADGARKLLDDIRPLAVKLRDYPRLWLLQQAQLALLLDQPIHVHVATRHLVRLRADQSVHPLYQSVIASLKQADYWPEATPSESTAATE